MKFARRFARPWLTLLALLFLPALAQAAAVANIDASGWATYDGKLVTTGSADSTHVAVSSLGLNTIANNLWTCKSFAANSLTAPTGSSATGYIESKSGLNNASDDLYFQIDADTTWNSGLSDYWIDFWVRGTYDGSTSMGTSQILAKTIRPIISSGTFARPIVCVNPASGFTSPPGWAMYANNNGSGGTDIQLNPAGSSSGVTLAAWNKWHRVTYRFHYGSTSAGYNEVYLNGTLVNRNYGDTAYTSSSAGFLARVSLPIYAGGVWQVTGPIRTWNGTDATVPTITPEWGLNTSTDPVRRVYMPIGADSTPSSGVFWKTGGSATLAITDYGVTGSSPYRSRFVWSGNNLSGTVTTFDELGTLPYNDQGWASLVLSDIYVKGPSGAKLVFQAYKAGGTSNLFSVTFDSTLSAPVVKYTYDTATIATGPPYDSTVRHCFAIHLNQDGRARWTMFDVTTAAPTTALITRSGALPTWTPQALGKVILTATTQTSYGVECGYLAVCSRPTFAMVDSLSTTVKSNDSIGVNLRVVNYVSNSFPYGKEGDSIPGGYYPMAELGMPRRIVVGQMGINGLSRANWQASFGGGLKFTSGVEYLLVDGGSINDIATAAQTDTDLTSCLSMMKSNVDDFLTQAAANDNAVWASTMIPRTYDQTNNGTALDANDLTATQYSAAQRAAVLTFNTNLRNSLAATTGTKGLFYLSDIAADKVANSSNYPDTNSSAGGKYFWADKTHPGSITATAPYIGAGYYAKRMYETQTQILPPSPPGGRRIVN